jgi:hypothetical protein
MCRVLLQLAQNRHYPYVQVVEIALRHGQHFGAAGHGHALYRSVVVGCAIATADGEYGTEVVIGGLIG